jgi:hypothetical protein
MPEVSPDSGGQGARAIGDVTFGGPAPADGGASKLLGAGERHDGGELGVHVGFLSMASNVISE